MVSVHKRDYWCRRCLSPRFKRMKTRRCPWQSSCLRIEMRRPLLSCHVRPSGCNAFRSAKHARACTGSCSKQEVRCRSFWSQSWRRRRTKSYSWTPRWLETGMEHPPFPASGVPHHLAGRPAGKLCNHLCCRYSMHLLVRMETIAMVMIMVPPRLNYCFTCTG